MIQHIRTFHYRWTRGPGTPYGMFCDRLPSGSGTPLDSTLPSFGFVQSESKKAGSVRE